MIINDLFLLVNTNKKYEFPTFSHIKVNNKMIKFFQIYKYFQNRTTVDWNIILEDLLFVREIVAIQFMWMKLIKERRHQPW